MNREEENEPQPLRIIGQPKFKNGIFEFDDNIYAIMNRECGWICPRCYNDVRICPTKAGEQIFKCPNKHCSATFVVRVDADAVTFMPGKKKKSVPTSESVGAAGAVAAAAVNAAAGVVAQQQVQKPARGMLLMPVDDDMPKKPNTPPVSKSEPKEHDVSKSEPKEPVDKKPILNRPASEKPASNDNDDNETVIVQPPSNKPVANASQQESTGYLQWGGFFHRKRYKLLVGSNVIGRKDEKTPSDLEFEDKEMSRRSVKIDVIPDGQGDYSFTLTVMKALNAVKVNEKRLILGENVTLKRNDAIVMGKTTIIFKC